MQKLVIRVMLACMLHSDQTMGLQLTSCIQRCLQEMKQVQTVQEQPAGFGKSYERGNL